MCTGILELLSISQGKEFIENVNPTAFFSKNQHPALPVVDGVVYTWMNSFLTRGSQEKVTIPL